MWNPDLSIREKLKYIFKSNIFHIIIIVLVIVDVLGDVVELSLVAEQSTIEISDCNFCS